MGEIERVINNEERWSWMGPFSKPAPIINTQLILSEAIIDTFKSPSILCLDLNVF